MTGNAKLRDSLLLAAAFLVVAVWGETFISSKILLDRGLAPADIFFYRFLLAYLCVWPLSRKHLWAKSFKDELLLFALGALGGTLYFLAENTALKYSTASNVALILCIVPFVTALLMSALYRDERLHRKQLVGSLIALVGMLMVVMNGQLVLHLNPKGDLLALGAVLVWGLYSIVLKSVSSRYDAVFISRKVFVYGIVGIIPYFLLVEPLNTDLKLISQTVVWGNLVYLGIVASMLCFVFWNKALKSIGVVRTTNLLYVQPFITMLIARIVLDERITWMAVVGAVILTVGMVKLEKKSD